MSLLKIIKAQLGLSATATQNFTLTAENADGTMKLARGNAGATSQDILTVASDGTVSAGVQPTTGVRSLALATMQKFADEFGVSLAASGYQKLPSGLIIQWGTGNIAANNTLTNLALPVAWPNGLLQCSASWVDSGPTTGGIGSAAGTSPLTQIGFYNSYTSALNIRYIAIGY